MNLSKHLITITAFLSLGFLSFGAMAEETNAAPTASDHVARAVFTSEIQGREPTDTLTSLSNDKNKVYFFTDLRGLGGQAVTHRWEYEGKTMSEVNFNVGGPHWRVWSSKTLLPQWTGQWRVLVIDGDGNTVGESSFDYTAAQEGASAQ